MLSAELTRGMSTIEVIVVFLAAHASKAELKRLAAFFREYLEAS